MIKVNFVPRGILSVAVLACLFFVCGTLRVQAYDSVSWSSSALPQLWFAKTANQMNSAIVTVRYGVDAYQISSSGSKSVIACGSTVPKGTTISFEFVPHQDSDISWFGSGTSQDSPYGKWMAPGVVPDRDTRCAHENMYDPAVHSRNLLAHYAVLAMEPPQKELTISGASCSDVSNGKTCQLSSPGTVSARYDIASTGGYFYAGLREYKYPNPPEPHCYRNPIATEDVPMVLGRNGPSYRVVVPAQTLSCSITVSDVANDDTTSASRPSTPTLSASGTGSCKTETPYHVTMSATSPDSHRLRYLVDWDGDGSTDELVPPSGNYVASGATQNASRTFATTGHKTVQVRAQDDRGLLSAWATLSFDCSARTTNADTNTDGTLDGTTGTVGTAGDSITPDLSLRALPSLLRSGQSTRLSWSATNVSSCVVEGTNRDRWEAISSRVGGEQSSPIRQQTIYTLTCFTDMQTLRKSVTVDVLPSFREK